MSDSRSSNKYRPDSDGSWVMTMPLSDGMTKRVWPSELIQRMFPGVFGTETFGDPDWTADGRLCSVMLSGSWTRAEAVPAPAVCCRIWDTVSDCLDFVRTNTWADEAGLCQANTNQPIWSTCHCGQHWNNKEANETCHGRQKSMQKAQHKGTSDAWWSPVFCWWTGPHLLTSAAYVLNFSVRLWIIPWTFFLSTECNNISLGLPSRSWQRNTAFYFHEKWYMQL